MLKKLFSLLLTAALLFTGEAAYPAAHAAEPEAPAPYTDGPADGLEAEELLDGVITDARDINPDTCIVLMDADTGAVLYEQNPRRRAYPASTTKILSTLIAIESGDLDELITVGSEVDIPSSWTHMTPVLTEGETISLHDLIYGAMLPSGCDASAAIGAALGGNGRDFAEWMNRRALSLGMNSSHFVNPHGVADEDHYSTAMDMARLCRAAMDNEFLREVVSTLEYVTPPTNVCGERTLTNTNEMLDIHALGYYGWASGIKTGTTPLAKYCLTGYAEKDGRRLVLVILAAPSNRARYGYANNCFSYAFFVADTAAADAFFEVCEPVNEVMTLTGPLEYYYCPDADGQYLLGSYSEQEELLIKYAALNAAGELWYFTAEGYFMPASAFASSDTPVVWGFCADELHPLPAGEYPAHAVTALRGTVYADRFIESAEAEIINAEGVCAAFACCETYSTYFDLAELEDALFAGPLPAGEYTLHIRCTAGESEYSIDSAFVILPPVPGDVNDDGAFNFNDISTLSMYLLGTGALGEGAGANADYNGDGKVDFKDISDMYMAILG